MKNSVRSWAFSSISVWPPASSKACMYEPSSSHWAVCSAGAKASSLVFWAIAWQRSWMVAGMVGRSRFWKAGFAGGAHRTASTIVGRCALLSDTKTGKNHTQELVGTEFARDLVQRVLGQPQVLGQQVQRRRARRRQVDERQRQVFLDPAERLHVPGARQIQPFGHGLP